MVDGSKFLGELGQFIENVDKETTLLLQNLQWDHKHVAQKTAMSKCKYDSNHVVPAANKEAHEQQCYLVQEGYNKKDILLPDPVDPDANTVVKLSKHDINKILNKASSSNPNFKRGIASSGGQPLTVERLQQVYTADERRAIHDAVVSAAPFCHDLADLALPSTKNEGHGREKSRMEILAELRDMKRRRAKYRVAAKTSNYSDVLRDVIKTQMELYAEAKGIFIKTEYGPKSFTTLNKSSGSCNDMPDVVIKHERISPESDRTSKSYKESSYDYNKQRKIYNGHNEYRHKSRTDRYHDDSRHKSQRDRPSYENEQSKTDKAEDDHRDRYERNYKNSKGHGSANVGRKNYSDYGRKNDDISTERTKYHDKYSKKHNKHTSHREGHSSNRNHSKSYHYSDREDNSKYSRKRSSDIAFHRNRDEKPSSSKIQKYERNND